MHYTACTRSLVTVAILLLANVCDAQQSASPKATAGSLIEDRAAAKLLDAAQARYDAGEPNKAVEIWESVIERYPRSRYRFAAHVALGNHFLQRAHAYDRARVHFELAAGEENRDEGQRAEASVRIGMCYFHLRNFGKSFQVMRDVIDQFPGSLVVNDAWYYIGLGHFQLGHYGRAISALENVGTAVSPDQQQSEKLEAGKRLFVRIEDADLAILEPDQPVKVSCITDGGDREMVSCFPITRNARLAIGSIPTRLGTPAAGNGQLEIRGDDTVKITYTDRHTAAKTMQRAVSQSVQVVGSATVAVTDGAFQDSLQGVVLGKNLNVQVDDGDRDVSNEADVVKALVTVFRPTESPRSAGEQAVNGTSPAPSPEDAAGSTVRLAEVDKLQLVLREAVVVEGPESLPASASAESVQDKKPPKPVHSGLFRATVELLKSPTPVSDNYKLEAIPGDIVRVVYLDQLNRGPASRDVQAEAKCLEGNIGSVRISQAKISDQELRIQTQLRTASALTNIGNRYKEFGLKTNADSKYNQALAVCEEIMHDAAQLGGSVLEQTYVQLWRIYFEMERLDLAAAMCQRLQRDFPASGFVDEALLQLAEVARKQKDFPRAIQTYSSLLAIKTSVLRGEAQFGIAQCYDQMAEAAEEKSAIGLRARAFEAYKKVLDQYPDSGRVGDAVSKMATFYYEQKDYARAVEVFENVLLNYPDAKFLDVILFNYGRCLYRMNRKPQALEKFEQLLAELPDSSLAADTKKIVDALRSAGK